MTFFDRAVVSGLPLTEDKGSVTALLHYTFSFTEVKSNLKDSESPRPRTTIGVGTARKGSVSPKAELLLKNTMGRQSMHRSVVGSQEPC